MKRIKLILTIVFILTLCLTVSGPVYASEEKEMVYADKKTQNELYSMLNSSTFDLYAALQADNLMIVKESITRVYTISLLKYAQSGSFEVEPMTSGVDKNSVYIAKVVTSDGAYAGNISFYVNNNTAYNLLFSPSPVLSDYYAGVENPRYIASCSYADHAQRIQGMVNRSSFVPVENVKYIVIDNVTQGFLVEDEKTFNIIPAGYMSTERFNTVDVNLTSSDLSDLASEYLENYNKQMKEREEWASKHPNEEWSFTGAYLSPIISGVSAVDNINNIYEYLNIPMNDLPKEDTSPYIISAIFAVLCFAVFLTTIFVIKKVKSRKRK
ncbi:MAG: hypothetical protein E7665_10410 [Ruminococcaceae bacterium]|nr:hypothetical protein [Oscillospiraceae bacterium]